jgi:small redox-active disulfide protein 2
MNIIKIFGTGCPRCNELEKMCFNILAENNIDADLQKVTDIKEIALSGVISTPALMINDKIVLSGMLPTKESLLKIISDNIKK